MKLMLLALTLQSFWPLPITNAYAVQRGKDVVVSVTYETQRPKSVCVYLYAVEDREMSSPSAMHCIDKIDEVGDFDTWRDADLNTIGNFEVVVKYPDGHTVVIDLTGILNS